MVETDIYAPEQSLAEIQDAFTKSPTERTQIITSWFNDEWAYVQGLAKQNPDRWGYSSTLMQGMAERKRHGDLTGIVDYTILRYKYSTDTEEQTLMRQFILHLAENPLVIDPATGTALNSTESKAVLEKFPWNNNLTDKAILKRHIILLAELRPYERHTRTQQIEIQKAKQELRDALTITEDPIKWIVERMKGQNTAQNLLAIAQNMPKPRKNSPEIDTLRHRYPLEVEAAWECGAPIVVLPAALAAFKRFELTEENGNLAKQLGENIWAWVSGEGLDRHKYEKGIDHRAKKLSGEELDVKRLAVTNGYVKAMEGPLRQEDPWTADVLKTARLIATTKKGSTAAWNKLMNTWDELWAEKGIEEKEQLTASS